MGMNQKGSLGCPQILMCLLEKGLMKHVIIQLKLFKSCKQKQVFFNCVLDFMTTGKGRGPRDSVGC